MHSEQHAAHKCTPKVHAGGPELGRQNPRGDPGGPPRGHPRACKTKATTDHNMHTCRHQHVTMILKASAGWGKACYAPHMQKRQQHQQILPPAPAITCMD